MRMLCINGWKKINKTISATNVGRSVKGGFLIMINDLISEDYKDFIGEIKNKIRNSQYEAMKQVNKTLINLYWGIGQEIYNQQQEKGWGKSIVEVLSKELKKEFPDVHGLSYPLCRAQLEQKTRSESWLYQVKGSSNEESFPHWSIPGRMVILY